MWLVFVLLPLAVVLGADVSAGFWWARRRRLMDSGVPVTGEVVRINISVTDFVDPNTRMVRSSSTTIRPVVRFTTLTGEPITASPMRSGVDKLLIPGDPVKIRYSTGNPMRCVVDQRGATQGTAGMLAALVFINIFLIGFASVGWNIVGDQANILSPTPPSIPQGFGLPTGSEAGSHTTSPPPPVGATTAGVWSADNGPLTVTIVKVVNAGGNVTLTVSAHDGASESVTLPIFGYFAVTDDRGNSYTANPLDPIIVPAGGTASDTLTLDQTVPAAARSLNLTWAHIFSQDLALNGSISITGVPLAK